MPDVLWTLSRHCEELQGVDWLNPTHVVCSVAAESQRDAFPFSQAELELASDAPAFGLAASIPNLAPVERILSARSTPAVHFLAVVDGCPTKYEPFRATLLRALLRKSLAVLVARPATSACLRQLFDQAKREVFRVHRIPDAPDGPAPVRSEQRGNLLFLEYGADVPVDELMHAVLQAYGVPWMGDSVAPRGVVPAAVRKWLAAGAGALVGIGSAYLATGLNRAAGGKTT